MRKFFLLIVFCFFSINIFASDIASNHLAQLLNNIHSYQANFSQTTIDQSHNVVGKSTGLMQFLRPGRFRWETKTPDHQLIITNGATLWIYDVDLEQATKQSTENLPMNPAKLLSGHVYALLSQFYVTENSHHHNTTFQLTPKNKHSEFSDVSITFSHNDLTQMQIQTSLSQSSAFTFSNIKMNPVFAEPLFNFRPPKGVDVLQ